MRSVRFAFLLAAIWIGAPLCAQTTSEYQKFYQALSPLESIKTYSHLQAVQRVRSRLEGVEPNKIEITILTTPPQKIAIAADGRMQFPINDALQKANPSVQSNQPKGSLSLSSMLEYKLTPGAREFNAKLVAEMMQQTRSALTELDSYAQGRELAGIEFVFAQADAKADVTDRQRERTLYADRGQIIVRIEGADTPTLRLSHVPLAARPYLEARYAPK
jgi:hypothetical protein